MTFKILFSITFGIIIGTILYYQLHNKKIYHGPNSNMIRRTIFHDKKNNKCYIFEPHLYLCPVL